MATKKPARPAPGRNGFKYREQFGVIVKCRDEAHQRQVYDALKAAGHKLRVVTV
ncbi:hypothetical protein ANDA3_3730 [plant metagenome]|uniref:Uncharacterized protein n=1 Tax=plant metagenome TaxID=1297885 RepID=A0A484TDA0_9ZZZZ